MKGSDSELASAVYEACIGHARKMLASQQPLVDAGKFDFMQSFRELATHLYLAGVMWKYGEQFDLPTNARDRAFLCLAAMLTSDGMGSKQAIERIASLNQNSRRPDGTDTLAIAAGYAAKEGDGSLAAVFEKFRNSPEVSGAPYRFLDKVKPIAAISAVASATLSLLLNLSLLKSIAIGAVVGFAILGVGLALYRQMTKSR